MTDIAAPMAIPLTVTRGNKKAFTVRPLKAEAAKTKTEPAVKEETPNQKTYRRIATAIDASPDAADVLDLWNESYAADLDAFQKDVPKFWAALKEKYDIKAASFEAETTPQE